MSCRFGPLICLWCMRFEGMHSYFKVYRCKFNLYRSYFKVQENLLSLRVWTVCIYIKSDHNTILCIPQSVLCYYLEFV